MSDKKLSEKLTSDPKIIPKYVPVKCVVCNGYGKVTYQRVTCHGCQGLGYILVEAKEEENGK